MILCQSCPEMVNESRFAMCCGSGWPLLHLVTVAASRLRT